VEELQTTKSEKLLALVMLVFLLIGGIWSYQEIDDRVRDAIELAERFPQDVAATRRFDQAFARSQSANRAVTQTRQDVEFRREEFRAALDADRPSVALERRYRAAQQAFAAAQAEARAAKRALDAAKPAADAAQRRFAEQLEEQRDRQELVTFLLRLALVLVALVVGFVALAQLRNRNSRYLPLAGSVLAFATIMAFGLAGDYLTDYFNPFDFGLLLLSLIGVAATSVAFWTLQRYLARRLLQRRVRRSQCPSAADRSVRALREPAPRRLGPLRDLRSPVATRR
jgi:hypothetical protein